MADEITTHHLTEKFFDLTMLFNLEMQEKDGTPFLYQGQGNILMALGKQDGLSQRQLAEQLDISAPSVTEFVNKLVKKGLVTKTRSAKDKRVFLIHLTAAGRQSQQQVTGADIAEWDLLTPQQQTEFAKMLDILISGVQSKYNDDASKQALASLRRHFLARASQ